LALGTLLAGCTARAQEGAWCAYAGGRDDYQDCGYYTLQQCVASVRGVGGACRPNPRGGYGPRYGGPPGPPDYDDVPPPPSRRRVPRY
jgi:hypothetical protein